MFKRIAAAVLCALAAMGLTGCRDKTPSAVIPLDTTRTTAPADNARETAPRETPAQSGQLTASAQTREEAEQIAELYGIELVDFAAPSALYATQEDPEAVIQRGIDNGWPLLEINHIKELS